MKYVRAGIINIIYQIATAGSAVVCSGYLYSEMNSEEYIGYSMLITSVFVLNYANFGIPSVTTRLISSCGSKSSKFYNYIVYASLLANAGVMLATFFCLAIIIILIKFANDRSSIAEYLILLFPIGLNYFLTILWRSVSDGLGDFHKSRTVKAYFYISLYISLVAFEYFKLSVYLKLLSLFSIGIPFLVYTYTFLKNNVFSSFILLKAINILKEGSVFFTVSLLSVLLGFLDRTLLVTFHSGKSVSTILFVLDIAGRQSAIGASVSNIFFKVFSKGDLKYSLIIKWLKIAVLFYVLLSILIFSLFKEKMLSYLGGIQSLSLPVVSLAWAAYAILVVNAVQWQKIIAIKMEKKWLKFLTYETIALIPFLFVFIWLDPVYSIPVIIFLRSLMQVSYADILTNLSGCWALVFVIVICAAIMVFSLIDRI